MIQEITLEPHWTLDDYAAIPALADRVRMLRAEAAVLAPALKGRTVWMVNSTGQGGGVAEMLPRLCTLLGEMGVKTVDEEGRVRFLPARIVDSDSDGVWLGGLPEELLIITVGQEFVAEGQRVKAVDAETLEPLPFAPDDESAQGNAS